MLSVVSVLRSGGDYLPEHVFALADGVRRNMTLPYKFICLTDLVEHVRRDGIEAVELPHRWPGWWAKLCLWKPGLLSGPCFYSDLDTIIVDSLDHIATGHHFTVLKNFWAGAYRDPVRIGSGLMAWETDLSAIYHAFEANPARFIREYQTKARWGDQGFIKDHTPVEPDRWQQKHPGRVVSFKKHVLPNRGVPKGAAVCCFHGQPRPFDLPLYQRTWFQLKVQNAA